MAPKPAPRLFPIAPALALAPDRLAPECAALARPVRECTRGHHIGPCGILANLAETSYRNAQRMLRDGAVTWWMADRIAVNLGHHPATVWPDEWAALVADDLATPDETPDQGEEAA